MSSQPNREENPKVTKPAPAPPKGGPGREPKKELSDAQIASISGGAGEPQPKGPSDDTQVV
jgi:hypothetical protein